MSTSSNPDQSRAKARKRGSDIVDFTWADCDGDKARLSVDEMDGSDEYGRAICTIEITDRESGQDAGIYINAEAATELVAWLQARLEDR